MGGIVGRVAPPRLGTRFRWSLGSSWASYLGDGVGVAAGPLLVASQTDDPLLVALAVTLQRRELSLRASAALRARRRDRPVCQASRVDDAAARTLLDVAIAQARLGLAEGGIPIGAALAIDGELVATGRNRRVQDGSAIRHGETDCLEHAGRLTARDYARATIATTLSPCDMCTGAILLYRIPRVVIGEHRTFLGGEELLRSRGVEVVVVDDPTCVELMSGFIAAHPQLWNEDIGVP